MSLTLTVVGRQAMVNAFWTPDIFIAVPTLYVAYSTSVPQSNADASEIDEPDPAAGYGRPAYTMDSAHWAPTGYGEVFNSQSIPFPNPVSADWGMIIGIALTDSPTLGEGTVYVVGRVVEPFDPDVGTTPQLEIGDLLIGLYE